MTSSVMPEWEASQGGGFGGGMSMDDIFSQFGDIFGGHFGGFGGFGGLVAVHVAVAG